MAALTHGSATSRVLSLVAARRSVASFIEVTGEFVSKDVAAVRGVAKELGSDLGALEDVIGAIDFANRGLRWHRFGSFRFATKPLPLALQSATPL